MDSLTDNPIVVESSVWVEYFRGLRTPHTTWLLQQMGWQHIIILDVILCEVLRGIPRESDFQLAKQHLLEFELHSAVGKQIAINAAQNYRGLRDQGITIRKTIDCIIATCCINNGFSLLHNDRDFDPFELNFGLKVIHPPDDRRFIQ